MRQDGCVRRLVPLIGLILVAALWWWVDTSTEPMPADSTTSETSIEDGTGGLPVEALQTLDLVDQGGPFPYDRDGTTFQNRERLLPAKPSGYWKEYTVPTPGASDRGARRLVVGAGGEVYYTADHYQSFRLIREGDGRSP